MLEEMKKNRVEPDVVTYSTLVKGYGIGGDVDRVPRVMEDMNGEKKYGPDEILCNTLLDGCEKQGRVDDVLQLRRHACRWRLAPSNYTLSILVKLMGRACRFKQGLRLGRGTLRRERLPPNVQVYTGLVQAYAQNRKLDRALALHEAMITEEGCAADEKFYSARAPSIAASASSGPASPRASSVWSGRMMSPPALTTGSSRRA